MSDLLKRLLELTKNFVQYILISIGVLLLVYCTFALKDGPWQTLLTNFSTAFIVAGVVSETWNRFVARTEEEARKADLETTIKDQNEQVVVPALDRSVRAAVSEEFAVRQKTRAGVAEADISELNELPLKEMISTSQTIYMTFLYEPLWSATGLLKEWLERNPSHRLFVFMPDPDDRKLMRILGSRHGADTDVKVAQFAGKVKHARNNILDLGDRPQVQLWALPSPGPSYSGYLFDPDYHADVQLANGRPPGDGTKRAAIQRIYKHGMRGNEKLPTLVIGPGSWWDDMKADVEYLSRRCKRMDPVDESLPGGNGSPAGSGSPPP